MTIEQIADRYVQNITEWDDRTSPEDWPDALLITGEELRKELIAFAHEIIEMEKHK